MRKINTVIFLRSGQEIDNQVENSKEPCKFPHDLFKNSSTSPSSKIASSNNSGDTTDGVPIDSEKDLPSNSSHNQNEPQKDHSTNLSSPKDSLSPSSTTNVQ